MPNSCCVPGCRSGYKGTTTKVSLFSLPLDKELREKWKRAIPRQESAGFSFDSKHTRVCANHFDASDVVTAYDMRINGVVVSLEREKPALKRDAVPRIFEDLPSRTKRKRRSRPPRELPREPSREEPRASPTPKADAAPKVFEGLPSSTKRKLRSRPPLERPREPSPTPLSDHNGAASANDDLPLTNTDAVEMNLRDAACQTDIPLVECASCAEVQRLQCKLLATKQLLRKCQTKLAELRKQR